MLKWLNKTKRSSEEVSEKETGAAKKVCANTNDKISNATSSVNMMDQHVVEKCEPVFPACWTVDQYTYFTKGNDWLMVKQNTLGCSTCGEVSRLGLGPQSGTGVNPAKEWVNCEVSFFGSTKEAQQLSLRKKIAEHKKTTTHLKCISIVQSSKKKLMELGIQKMSSNLLESTVRVFRTAYKEAKMNRPYTDFPIDIELQEMNGLNMGRILHSNFSCANIVDHISEQMRKKIAKHLLENNVKLSLLIDESTTISNKPVLVICLRGAMSSDTPVHTFLWDFVELSDTTAKSITEATLGRLDSYGLNETYLKANLIGFACDGASVMLGKKKGVATEMKNLFPNIIVWHCSNHRLELAVHDTLNEVQGVTNVHYFFDKLYSTYSLSPKNQIQLNECAASLGQTLSKIGKIFTIRWVASSLRSVKAVWESYKSLAKHFMESSNDEKRDGKERSKYSGLYKILTSCEFINNLGLLYDALTELSDLSLCLQERQITLPDADRAIKRTIRVLESMIHSPGPYQEQAITAVKTLMFKDTSLQPNTKVKEIHSGQFLRSLAENLKQRLVHNVSQAAHLASVEPKRNEQLETLFNDLKTVSTVQWPEETEVTKADRSVNNLCDIFRLTDKRKYVNGFREFIETNVMSHSVKIFMQVVHAIPVSTSECERSFSAMNEIITEKRNSLHVQRMSNLAFIKCVGPPLAAFDPTPYVQLWLQSGKRTAEETACRKCETKKDIQYEAIWNILK